MRWRPTALWGCRRTPRREPVRSCAHRAHHIDPPPEGKGLRPGSRHRAVPAWIAGSVHPSPAPMPVTSAPVISCVTRLDQRHGRAAYAFRPQRAGGADARRRSPARGHRLDREDDVRPRPARRPERVLRAGPRRGHQHRHRHRAARPDTAALVMDPAVPTRPSPPCLGAAVPGPGHCGLTNDHHMDPFHERLARVGLTALAPYGFALAGGDWPVGQATLWTSRTSCYGIQDIRR